MRGRGERLAKLGAAMASVLGFDEQRTAFVARLTALGRLHDVVPGDDYDPLSRLGREARASDAQTAKRILGVSPTFAEFAPVLGACAEWFDGTGLPARLKGEEIPAIARLLAVAMAADAMEAASTLPITTNLPDIPVRLAAAAGTQFDPAMVEAYVTARGAQ